MSIDREKIILLSLDLLFLPCFLFMLYVLSLEHAHTTMETIIKIFLIILQLCFAVFALVEIFTIATDFFENR